MTTIAATSTDIAWDNQQTFGENERAFCADEKVVVVGKKILAFAGDSHMQESVFKWIANGAKLKSAPKDGEWECLVITQHGARHYHEKGLPGYPVALPFQMGTGAVYASGAFALGEVTGKPTSALFAVRAAAKRDTNTGTGIKNLSFKEAFKRVRK